MLPDPFGKKTKTRGFQRTECSLKAPFYDREKALHRLGTGLRISGGAEEIRTLARLYAY
jgi:hypothetical protein